MGPDVKMVLRFETIRKALEKYGITIEVSNNHQMPIKVISPAVDGKSIYCFINLDELEKFLNGFNAARNLPVFSKDPESEPPTEAKPMNDPSMYCPKCGGAYVFRASVESRLGAPLHGKIVISKDCECGTLRPLEELSSAREAKPKVQKILGDLYNALCNT